jgi:hypothetical protein
MMTALMPSSNDGSTITAVIDYVIVCATFLLEMAATSLSTFLQT